MTMIDACVCMCVRASHCATYRSHPRLHVHCGWVGGRVMPPACWMGQSRCRTGACPPPAHHSTLYIHTSKIAALNLLHAKAFNHFACWLIVRRRRARLKNESALRLICACMFLWMCCWQLYNHTQCLSMMCKSNIKKFAEFFFFSNLPFVSKPSQHHTY